MSFFYTIFFYVKYNIPYDVKINNQEFTAIKSQDFRLLDGYYTITCPLRGKILE
jgi:hypothetical protein